VLGAGCWYTRVALDYGCLTVGFGYDQNSWVGDGWVTVGGGLDRDFDGFFDYGSFGYVDEEAVFEICCV
jgi:hypothetical protein